MGSISSTFYVQLLRTWRVQKRKKYSQVVSLFTLSGSTSVKAERKYVGEIVPGSQKTKLRVDGQDVSKGLTGPSCL